MTTIEYKGYRIEGKQGEDGVYVTVTWKVPDVPEAEQLITGCRTLGLRPAPAAEKPAEARPKLAAVPPPPAEPKAEPKKANGAAKAKPAEEAQRESFAEGNVAVDRGEGARRTAPDEPAEKAPAAEAAPKAGKMKLTITQAMRAGTFRVAVEELAKQGFDSKATLLKVVPKIRDQVPAIKAVPEEQIEARIDMAVDILGLNG